MSRNRSPEPVDDVALRRRAEVAEALTAALVCDWPMMGAERDFAGEVIDDLAAKGFQVVRMGSVREKLDARVTGAMLAADVMARAAYAVGLALEAGARLPRDLQVQLILSFIGEYAIDLKMRRPS